MPYRDDINLPQISSADAGAVCRKMADFRNWTSRRSADGEPVIQISAAERRMVGERELFALSLLRVYQIAVTDELVQLGFSPKRAARYARAFTDSGGGKGDRLPGRIYARAAATILVVDPEKDWGKVVPLFSDADLWYALNLNQTLKVAIVNLSQVVGRVRAQLGLPVMPPADQLAQVGPEKVFA